VQEEEEELFGGVVVPERYQVGGEELKTP